MRKSRPSHAPLTAGDVRLMLSNPTYCYGIDLQPAERAAEAVMRLNAQLVRLLVTIESRQFEIRGCRNFCAGKRDG